MKNYSEFYNLIQPFVETGFYIADIFLCKCLSFSDVKNVKPYTDMPSYAICFDMKLENFGYGDRKRPIPCDKALLMFDTDSFMPVKYFEIDKLIASVEIFLGELHIEGRYWDINAFCFGFLLRAPILGSLVIHNIYSKSIIIEKELYKKQIRLNTFKLKLLQIRQNYIAKFMHDLGYDVIEYKCCDFQQAVELIYSQKIPFNIKRNLHTYLAMYMINISLCKGETQDFFQALGELYQATKGKNSILSIWCLENLIGMTNNEILLNQLNLELTKIKSNIKNEDIKNKEIETKEVYEALFEIAKDNVKIFSLKRKLNKQFTNEIIWIILWGYCWDKETSDNIIELMNTCYESEQEDMEECVEFIDLIIEILLYHGYVHTLVFTTQAKAHYQLGNKIKSLFLLKEVLKFENNPDALLLISKIYSDYNYFEKAKDYLRRYEQSMNEED